MKTLHKRGPSLQAGQAIVLITLMMVALLGFLALAIDGARYYQMRRFTQNGADTAALAGIYYLSETSSPTPSGTWNAIVASITSNGILSANGIPTATTILPNGQIPLQTWWLNRAGTVLSEFTGAIPNNDITSPIPPTAHAIKVTTRISYKTFFGTVTQEYLPTEATAVARETMFAKAPLDFPYSLYIAGPTCNDTANVNWAAAVFNSQHMTFNSDVWINGTLAWDYYNNPDC